MLWPSIANTPPLAYLPGGIEKKEGRTRCPLNDSIENWTAKTRVCRQPNHHFNYSYHQTAHMISKGRYVHASIRLLWTKGHEWMLARPRTSKPHHGHTLACVSFLLDLNGLPCSLSRTNSLPQQPAWNESCEDTPRYDLWGRAPQLNNIYAGYILIRHRRYVRLWDAVAGLHEISTE